MYTRASGDSSPRKGFKCCAPKRQAERRQLLHHKRERAAEHTSSPFLIASRANISRQK